VKVLIREASAIKTRIEINLTVEKVSKKNKNWNKKGLGTHLFVKVPRSGVSEVTFSVIESNCHLLLPI